MVALATFIYMNGLKWKTTNSFEFSGKKTAAAYCNKMPISPADYPVYPQLFNSRFLFLYTKPYILSIDCYLCSLIASHCLPPSIAIKLHVMFPPVCCCWCQKTRVIALLYVIKILAVICFILSQSTRVTDRRTDRHTKRITTAIPHSHAL